MATSTKTFEEKFLDLWRSWELGPEPIRNAKVIPGRRLEIDFCWPDIRLAVECQGGIFAKERSGHSNIPGMKRDMEKNNLLQCLGWVLLQIHAGDIVKANHDNLRELLITAAQLQVSRITYERQAEALSAEVDVRSSQTAQAAEQSLSATNSCVSAYLSLEAAVACHGQLRRLAAQRMAAHLLSSYPTQAANG